jgi:hypothetical protein
MAAKPYKFGQKVKDKYLGALRSGMRRGAAARAAGVCRSTICDRMAADPAFAAECDQAEADACDVIKDALWQTAKEGNVQAIRFWLVNSGYHPRPKRGN